MKGGDGEERNGEEMVGGGMLRGRKEKATGREEVLLWIKYIDRRQVLLPPLPLAMLRLVY